MQALESFSEILKNIWGYDAFRPLQKEAIRNVAAGRDSVVVLPTGGGKSICYQIPALMMKGTALIVSPLISLMKDQVDSLRECGVEAGRLDSSLEPDEYGEVMTKLQQGELKLLYLSPERLISDGFADTLDGLDLSFIAIDEAHCVSMWGHDFRPEYRMLGALKQRFSGIALHAYTATATPHVRDDIATQLHLETPEILVGSFDRPNLRYKVERAENRIRQVKAILGRHPGESGIVYCIRRKDVDTMCAALVEAGFAALPYHAGMDDEARKRNQEAFIDDKAAIIVATVAFGMGIDKPDVRFVVHSGMPKSLEHYQQESGRAGRDGLEAECVLMYSGGDYGIWKYFAEELQPEAKQIADSKLNDMFGYCMGSTCRHEALVSYFGQSLETSNCGACDICLGDIRLIDDALVTARKIISSVLRQGESFGADYTASVLAGSRDRKVLQNRHEQLSTHGLLSSYSKKIIRDWVEQLVAQGYLQKCGEYNVLKVSESGWMVLKEEETPKLLQPAEKKKGTGQKRSRVAESSWEGVDRELFDILRRLRSALASGKNVPAYIVFGDTALRDMARMKPTTLAEFLMVKGVGEMKCRQYGEFFVRAIEAHVSG